MNATFRFAARLILSVAALVAAVALFRAAASSFGELYAPKKQLSPGIALRVSEEKLLRIYYEYQFAYALQDTPEFIFWDSGYNRNIRSVAPPFADTYAVGGVKGILVAVASLPAGTYYVEYEAPEENPPVFVLSDGGSPTALAKGVIYLIGGGALLALALGAAYVAYRAGLPSANTARGEEPPPT